MDLLPLIAWTLLAVVPLVGAVFGYIGYQASHLLRSEVQSVPGGLRFSASTFMVEARRFENTVQVMCQNGHCKTQSLEGGEEKTRTGALTLALPAAGMRIQVAQIVVRNGPDAAATPTGFSTIVLTASDESNFKAQGKSGGQRSTVQLYSVPDPVAQTFKPFSDALEPWFEKLERDPK